MLEIRILGPIEVLNEGHFVPVGGPRQRAVVAVLALHCGRRVSIEQLIDGVWGENAPEASLKTVRAYVSRLRAQLGDGVLVPDSGGYRLAPTSVAVDADRFAELAAVGRSALADDAPARGERALTEALALWRGANIAEGAELEGELGQQRQLHELRLTAEELLLDALLAVGRNEEAIISAEALLSADMLRDGVWERLVLALHAAGRRADALAAFHRARRAVVEELGMEPGRSLADLNERLLQGAVPVPREAVIGGHLPSPVTSFIGREAELRTLSELISTSRMVTLLAVGGAGKTRLAIELASRWRAETGSPAWFVDLAPLREGRLVAGAVAAALGVPEAPNVDPLTASAERIGARRTLLLLDNCEHLSEAAAEFTVGVLERCPRLQGIATSRELLGVGGEGVYAVPPLAMPDERTPRWRPELPAGYDAVRLFVARAHAAGGAVTEQEIAMIADLCRQLDGLPLSIEFAAARSRSLSIAEIRTGMTDRFTVLADTLRAGPDRHRTLRASIDWSHDLLAGDEQRLLRRLSVFDGGFTTEAAAALDG